MKVIKRDFNFQELLNWGLAVIAIFEVGRLPHPRIFLFSLYAVFLLCNYRLSLSNHISIEPVRRTPKRFYHLPGIWILGGLGLYLVYALINTGWVFWFLLLGGTLGAAVATILRYREA